MKTLPSRLEFDLLTLRLKPTFAGVGEEEDDDDDADGWDNVVECSGAAVLSKAGKGAKDSVEEMRADGKLITLVTKVDNLDIEL